MKRTTALCLSVLTLAACDSPQAPPEPATSAPEEQATVEPPVTSPVEPPAKPAPFYVGRWAAAETACGHAFWDITEQGLETPAGVSCRFTDVKEITTGFEAAATCAGPKADGVSTIRFAYAQSAKALLVDAEPFANVGLVACKAG